MEAIPSIPIVLSEAPAPVGVTIPAKLHPPIDISKLKNENGVKDLIKKLLDAHGWFHFAVAAGGFGGTPGLHDRFAVRDGVFITIEAKWKYGKPTVLQRAFARHVLANECYAFCVSERNIDHFAWWLESFEIAKQCQMQGKEIPAEHGSRLLNAIGVLTDPFAEKEGA